MGFRDSIAKMGSPAVKMADDETRQGAVAVAEPQVVAEPEEVEYFHWAGRDEKGRAYPSSEIIHISGGERREFNGQVILMPAKHAQFRNGMLKTSDPETIKVLDRMCRDGSTAMSRDREVYYEHTMTAEQRLRRQGRLAEIQAQVIEEQKSEIGRLKARLEAMGGKPE